MSDPIEKQPEINFEDLDPTEDYKVVVEGRDPEADLPAAPQEADEYKGLTREQIIAKIEAERSDKARLAAAADTATAIKAGLEQLVSRGREAPPAAAPTSVPLDEAALTAELKEKIYEDPKAAIDTYVQKKLGPEIGRLFQTNLHWSRRDVERDPDTSDTFKKYRQEIEAEVQTVDLTSRISDPEVYRKAHDRVVSRHFNELVDIKVKEAVEKLKTPSTPPASSPPFAETKVSRPPGAPPQRVVRLSRDDWKQLEGMRRKGLGMSEKQFYEWKYGGGQ